MGEDIDLSYFNKRRAHMLRDLGRVMAQKKLKDNEDPHSSFLPSNTKASLESEFGVELDVLIELARQSNPPNKISMIVELEQLRCMLGHVPTKDDMKKHSRFDLSKYETEFQSWEQLLDRLGYDPWYKDAKREQKILPSMVHSPKQFKHEQEIMDGFTGTDHFTQLVAEATRIIQYSSTGAYLNDLKMLLGISEEEMSNVVSELVRVDGICSKKILRKDRTHSVLLYDKQKPLMSVPIQESHGSQGSKITRIKTAKIHPRRLYSKYKEWLEDLDSNIMLTKRKHFMSFQIHGKSLVAVIIQKSKIVCEFKIHVTDLDDPQKMLKDISDVGNWTSSYSRLNVFDKYDLDYCMNITRQCYDHTADKHVESHKKIHIENKTSCTDSPHNTQALLEMMINERISNRRIIDNTLQQRLTKEFLQTRSIEAVTVNHLELTKGIVKLHVRTPMRLPIELRMRNEEGLHPDPETSLEIALFAVNHHDWDGNRDTVKDVMDTAESISCALINRHNKSKTPRETPNYSSPQHDRNLVSTAISVWIAVATLHIEFGMDEAFSTQEIAQKVDAQHLCDVSRETILVHISSHCVANTSTTNKSAHRKTYRVESGRYRLYRRGEYCHPTRESCNIAPLPFQIPPKYRNLRRWYDDEYCTHT